MHNTNPIDTSLFALFKIGPGPSSSHTMGPMLAAYTFRKEFDETLCHEVLPHSFMRVRIFGSLSATGIGHGTDQALMAGLLGFRPYECPQGILGSFSGFGTQPRTLVWQDHTLPIPFGGVVHDSIDHDFPYSNTMIFDIVDENGNAYISREFYSIGGGFILAKGETPQEHGKPAHLYSCMADLHEVVRKEGKNIYEIMMDNEVAITGRSRPEIIHELNSILDSMDECVERGLSRDGFLPGSLMVQRKAGILWEKAQRLSFSADIFLTRLSAYAFAAAEENAAGGVVVTAPTCGSAGVMPSMVRMMRHDLHIGDRAIREGFLAAAAVGFIAKHNASISGAEVGCQGEIGVASAMAAAMITDAKGNRLSYTESASEIALEHHLGLTCDPVGGYVQIPCIERNAMGALKAYAASTIALGTNPSMQRVSLDAAIAAMAETGQEMHAKFKETSLGGLASLVSC